MTIKTGISVCKTHSNIPLIALDAKLRQPPKKGEKKIAKAQGLLIPMKEKRILPGTCLFC